MSKALSTDLYELNMTASYLRQGMKGTATFSLFSRSLPSNRGFLVAAGLDDCLSFLENFSFDPVALEYLASIGFNGQTLESFRSMRFTGDVWAVPEGSVIFANEPILEITAPIAEAQVVESYLLNQCTFQTAIATKAARYRVAAGNRIDLVDFSLRRAHGIEAANAVARLSAMCGFIATSNVEAARRFGLRPSGTMAHAYVEAFEDELEAFLTFARDFPEQAVFLVDTYDTLSGVNHAIEAIRTLGLEHHAGVRLDSGDLVALARQTRALLDTAGLDEVKILASGGLDEHDLARFVAEKVPINAAGIGTKLGVSADAPYLETAYKLVEYEGRPVVKLSSGKATLPGPKQIFRMPGMRDTIACRGEPSPRDSEPIVEQVMSGGSRTQPRATIAALRSKVERQLLELPIEALDLDSPVAPIAGTSQALRILDENTRAAAFAIANR